MLTQVRAQIALERNFIQVMSYGRDPDFLIQKHGKNLQMNFKVSMYNVV